MRNRNKLFIVGAYCTQLIGCASVTLNDMQQTENIPSSSAKPQNKEKSALPVAKAYPSEGLSPLSQQTSIFPNIGATIQKTASSCGELLHIADIAKCQRDHFAQLPIPPNMVRIAVMNPKTKDIQEILLNRKKAIKTVCGKNIDYYGYTLPEPIPFELHLEKPNGRGSRFRFSHNYGTIAFQWPNITDGKITVNSPPNEVWQTPENIREAYNFFTEETRKALEALKNTRSRAFPGKTVTQVIQEEKIEALPFILGTIEHMDPNEYKECGKNLPPHLRQRVINRQIEEVFTTYYLNRHQAFGSSYSTAKAGGAMQIYAPTLKDLLERYNDAPITDDLGNLQNSLRLAIVHLDREYLDLGKLLKGVKSLQKKAVKLGEGYNFNASKVAQGKTTEETKGYVLKFLGVLNWYEQFFAEKHPFNVGSPIKMETTNPKPKFIPRLKATSRPHHKTVKPRPTKKHLSSPSKKGQKKEK